MKAKRRGAPRSTYRRTAAIAFLLIGTAALLVGALFWWRGRSTEATLAGRVGGYVQVIDQLFALPSAEVVRVDTVPTRRIYVLPDSRVLLDLTMDGRVRQVTIGREREVQDMWEPEPGDWTLAQARDRARAWLPTDATFVRQEPFALGDRGGGTVEVFDSPALARVIFPAVYLQFGARGPAGRCAITYYLTSAGGVAMVLVGLY